MYSQIFVRTRRYHSSSRPSSLGVVVSPYACFFLHPPFEGGIHFAAQRPRLRSIASIILTLFLDPLPRSSILVSGRATLRAYSPLTHPPPPFPWKSIVRGAGGPEIGDGPILFLAENCFSRDIKEGVEKKSDVVSKDV